MSILGLDAIIVLEPHLALLLNAKQKGRPALHHEAGRPRYRLNSVPLPGLEPGLPASEADALSSELQGRGSMEFSHTVG